MQIFFLFICSNILFYLLFLFDYFILCYFLIVAQDGPTPYAFGWNLIFIFLSSIKLFTYFYYFGVCGKITICFKEPSLSSAKRGKKGRKKLYFEFVCVVKNSQITKQQITHVIIRNSCCLSVLFKRVENSS